MRFVEASLYCLYVSVETERARVPCFKNDERLMKGSLSRVWLKEKKSDTSLPHLPQKTSNYKCFTRDNPVTRATPTALKAQDSL